MKVVVCLKQIPDTSQASALDESGLLVREGKEAVLDPSDEPGLEIGLRIIEQHGGELVAITMGPERATEALRKALSVGASRAILVTDSALGGSDVATTAKVLARAISAEGFDLVICGTESTDGATGMMPPQLAELLGVPQLTFAKYLEISDSTVTVHRQTEQGYQILKAKLPALVTVTAAIAELRYASLRGIMAARSKEIKVLNLADLGIDPNEVGNIGSKERVVEVADAPPKERGEVFVDDGSAVDKIVGYLKQIKVL